MAQSYQEGLLCTNRFLAIHRIRTMKDLQGYTNKKLLQVRSDACWYYWTFDWPNHNPIVSRCWSPAFCGSPCPHQQLTGKINRKPSIPNCLSQSSLKHFVDDLWTLPTCFNCAQSKIQETWRNINLLEGKLLILLNYFERLAQVLNFQKAICLHVCNLNFLD